MELHRSGVLEREKVRMIGANADAIDRGEDRNLFKGSHAPHWPGRAAFRHCAHHGGSAPGSRGTSAPFPLIVRPAFTLGGMGGGVAYNKNGI